MGDKGKLARAGHLPEHYNLKIRFIEAMINKYKESRLPELLWLFPNQNLDPSDPPKTRSEGSNGNSQDSRNSHPKSRNVGNDRISLLTLKMEWILSREPTSPCHIISTSPVSKAHALRASGASGATNLVFLPHPLYIA
jgi:hypothetical protein